MDLNGFKSFCENSKKIFFFFWGGRVGEGGGGPGGVRVDDGNGELKLL